MGFFFLSICCIPTLSKSASVLLQTQERQTTAFSWVKILKRWTLTILYLDFSTSDVANSGWITLVVGVCPEPCWAAPTPSARWTLVAHSTLTCDNRKMTPDIAKYFLGGKITLGWEPLYQMFDRQLFRTRSFFFSVHQVIFFCAKIVLRWHQVPHSDFPGWLYQHHIRPLVI